MPRRRRIRKLCNGNRQTTIIYIILVFFFNGDKYVGYNDPILHASSSAKMTRKKL